MTDSAEDITAGAIPVVLSKNEQNYGIAGPSEYYNGNGDMDKDSAAAAPPPPPPGCCQRFCQEEWSRRGGMFGIQEGGTHTLDIPATFGPTDMYSRLFKLLTWGFTISTTIYTWWLRREAPGFYLAFLTHWTILSTCAYTTCSLLQSSTNLPGLRPRQPTKSTDSISPLTKATWLLFEISASYGLIVTILYWTLQFEYDGSMRPEYQNVMPHGGIMVLVWIEGLVINRTPVRMKHVWIAILISFFYTVWTLIHAYSTDLGNPLQEDSDPETNDDTLYSVIDWEGSTVGTLITCLLVMFLAVPVVFWFMWLCSLFSYPCGFRGLNRRYISHTNGGIRNIGTDSAVAVGLHTRKDNVTIHETA